MGRGAVQRVCIALGVGCVIAVSASGCSLVEGGGQVWDIVQGDLSAQGPLRDAVTDLRALDGVDGAHYGFVAAGANGVEASITIAAASDASAEQLGEMLVVAARAFDSDLLDDASGTIELTHDDALLRQEVFSLPVATLRAEAEYWLEVREALGAPYDSTLSDAGAGRHQRLMAAPQEADPAVFTVPFLERYEQLVAIDEPEAVASVWLLPGVNLSGLPSTEVITLVRDLRESIPLADWREYDPERPEGGVEGLSLSGGNPFTSYPAIVIYTNERSELDWQRVVAAGAAAAHTSGVTFAYFEDGTGEQAQFFSGECEAEIDVTSADEELVAAVEELENQELRITAGFCADGPSAQENPE